MQGLIDQLLELVRAGLVILAFIVVAILVVGVAWVGFSPLFNAIRVGLERVGLDRLLHSRRLVRLTRLFRAMGRAYSGVRARLDGGHSHVSVRVVIDERLKHLAEGIRRSRDSVRNAVQSLKGLNGATGPGAITADVQALQRRTEEVARIGGEIDETEYQKRAGATANLVLGILFGLVFAMVNGVLLSQFFRSLIPYYFQGVPIAYPIAFAIVAFEIGLGWVIGLLSTRHDARRYVVIRWVLMAGVFLLALVEGFIFAQLGYRFEFDQPLFVENPWMRYWMAPFGLVFVLVSAVTGYVTHLSQEELTQSRGANTLQRQIRAANALVRSLPGRWDKIGARARVAEAQIDAYFSALGNKEQGLGGAIQNIEKERDALLELFANANVENWTQVAEGAGGDNRRDAAMNVGLFVATVAFLFGAWLAVSRLFQAAWGDDVSLPGWAWPIVGGFVTLAVYLIGLMPFQRLHLLEGKSGKVYPTRGGWVEYGVAGGAGALCAIALIWAGVAATSTLSGLFLGLLYVVGAAIVVLMGYFVERAMRGAMLTLSVLAAVLAWIVAGLLALAAFVIAWVVGGVFWLFYAICLIWGYPTHWFLEWRRRRAERPTPALTATSAPAALTSPAADLDRAPMAATSTMAPKVKGS